MEANNIDIEIFKAICDILNKSEFTEA